jgi:parallel beta-helix repeat protein
MRKEVLIIIFLFLLPAIYSIEITECTNITSSGTYTLTTDIIDSTITCFNISANNVILDGNGKQITGNAGDYIYGIWSVEATNLTIKNFEIITTFVEGVYFKDIELLSFENNTINSNWVTGVNLESINNSEIKKNEIHENDNYAIILGNSFKTNLSQNNITKNSLGVLIENSEEIIFSKNNISLTDSLGLKIDTSPLTKIDQNNISENSDGAIEITSSENSIIKNNYLFDSNSYSVEGSFSNNLTIEDNKIERGVGIYLISCENSSILKNNVSEGLSNGIYIRSSSNSNISYNNASLNAVNGIYLKESPNSFLKENKLEQNSVYGINLELSNETLILENILNLNEVSGIDITSEKAKIEKNEIIKNKVYGISISETNRGIEIIENEIGYNKIEGIFIDETENITILNNQIYSHENFGINLESPSEKNNLRIEGNILSNNTIAGIYLQNTNKTELKNNNFQNHSNYNILAEQISTNNSFVYYNKYGEINWNSPTFKNNLTLEAENISFNENIQIGRGWAYLNSQELLTLNKSAQILLNLSELTNLDGNIYRDGEICNEETSPSCIILTSFDEEELIFNVSSWSNYSVKENEIENEEENSISSTTNKYTPEIKNISDSELEEGKEINLKNLDAINFKIKDKENTLKLIKFNNTAAKIQIKEEVITWIEKGIVYEFDLNNDSIKDIKIIYEGISINPYGAKFLIQLLIKDLGQEKEFEEIDQKKDKSNENKFWIIIVAILVTIILFAIIYLKRKKQPVKYKK